jgi:hypothetical protein
MSARLWSCCSVVLSARSAVAAQANRRLRGLVVFALFFGSLAPLLLAQTPTPVNVPTWRYDVTHAGQNTSETELSPANVNGSTFGKLFSLPVDGVVYAQPLYLSGLTMSDGALHNVVFVATGHDSLYAFDADSNQGANANPIWQVTLLDAAHGATAGATTVPWQDNGSPDVAPEVGITGTPVINPATNTMYVVAATKESGAYLMRLHAINLLTGAEQPNSPVEITATVAGTGSGSSGGQLTFSPLWENQRVALDYYNGHVYFAFAAHGDLGPWHGWIFSYDATTMAQTAVVCLSPHGTANGVWMSGAGMPIDSGGTAGRLFLTSGNGTYSGYPPFSESSNLGDSTVAFDLSNGGLTPIDIFTSFNQATLSSKDLDLGSGGVLMLPDQAGANTHELVQAGKEGRIELLNRDSLGGYAAGATSNTNAIQDIPGEVGGLWSTPAYWNGNVYIWGSSDVAKMFSITSGLLSTTPVSNSTVASTGRGATFSVSSDGTQNGIAWAVLSDAYTSGGAEVLYAFDATDLSTVLYESDTNSTRDSAGKATKFPVPVVTNGKVYVAARGQVDVYGVFNNEPIAAAPVISPDGGTFSTAQSVTLSTTTSPASIFYTLDGSVPTPGSTLYTGPISIDTDTTVSAIASASGFIQSPQSSASFTFLTQTPAVTFAPDGGTYTSAQSVALSDTDANAAIYYTTDGTTPTGSSQPYTGPIAVAASMTIKAIAIDPSLQNSNIATEAYVIQSSAPTINYGSGFTSSAGLTLVSAAKVGSNLLQITTSGTTTNTGATWYATPVSVSGFTTDFNFQLLSAKGGGFTFAIQNAGASAMGPGGSGLGYGASKPGGTGGMPRSVAVKFDIYNNDGEGTDSTGYYTDGASPTIPATDMSGSGVILNSGHILHAHLTYDGTNLTMVLTDTSTSASFTKTAAINIPAIVGASTAYVGFTGGSTGGVGVTTDILSWTLSTQSATPTTAAPVFSPQGGNYSTAQNVTLADSASGAVIYYTTNGTTPTTGSAVYSGAIAVGTGTTTIEAMAVASGSSASAVVTAQYVVAQPVTAPPTFSPQAGTYSTAQNVTLADSTSGAVIYYTTNGTTPTTGSAVYSGAIPVGMGTTMIEAMAVASGSSASAVVTAQYVVALPVTAPPTFSPQPGTYSTAQNVTLADSTSGAVIYYTTNGTTPTTGSAVYSGAIAVGTGTTTIEAMAVASGSSPSAVVTAQYVVGSSITAPPSFSPQAGTYSAAQNVTLADSTSGAVIYYTTNGTTPTTSSAVYSSPIAVTATQTLAAIAVANGQTSSTATAAYVIQSSAPTINYGSGFSSSAGLTLVSAAKVGSNLLQITTSGATTNTGATWYATPVSVSGFTTDFNFQLLSAKGGGFTFAIQNAGASAMGPGGSGLGYGASKPGGTGGMPRSVAVKFDIYNNDGEGTDSTGYYTDGASPTIPATDMSGSGVILNSGHVLHAHLTYDGTNLTMVLTDTSTSASFTKTAAINIPAIVGASTAYVGFTGGSTGGVGVTTDILSWTLSTQ